jgi:two-component system, NarL family, nitrate/nitrite response regulator NarL
MFVSVDTEAVPFLPRSGNGKDGGLNMPKIGILDPNGLFRAALVSLLRALGFDDVIDAESVKALRPEDRGEFAPELWLISLDHAHYSIEDITKEVRAVRATSKIVFLAAELQIELLVRSFAAGASGYLLQNISRDALGKSLTLVEAGGNVFPAELASWFPQMNIRSNPINNDAHATDYDLSAREVEILRCLTCGQSNKVIAQSLKITEATVKVYLKRILRKVGVRNRTQAALWAAARGYTELAPVSPLQTAKTTIAAT